MKIRYLGRAAGPVPYYGRVTGTQYLVGSINRDIEVDDLDANGFLTLFEGRNHAFAEVVFRAEEAPGEESESTPPPSPGDPPAPVVPVVVVPPAEPADFTVFNGIGPAKQTALVEAGIKTYAQFAAYDTLKLAGITNVAMQAAQAWIDEAKALLGQ